MIFACARASSFYSVIAVARSAELFHCWTNRVWPYRYSRLCELFIHYFCQMYLSSAHNTFWIITVFVFGVSSTFGDRVYTPLSCAPFGPYTHTYTFIYIRGSFRKYGYKGSVGRGEFFSRSYIHIRMYNETSRQRGARKILYSGKSEKKIAPHRHGETVMFNKTRYYLSSCSFRTQAWNGAIQIGRFDFPFSFLLTSRQNDFIIGYYYSRLFTHI